MGRTLNKLTAVEVAKLSEPGMYGDGGGLYLRIGGGASKSWIFRYRRRDMGLGPYPAVSLAGAREAARRCREQLAAGQDPIEARVATKSVAPVRTVTFGELAEQEIAARMVAWKDVKSERAWRLTLETYAASLRKMPIDQVTTDTVMTVLEPLWTTRQKTADRLRNRIEIVWDRAMARDLVSRDRVNPARWKNHLSRLLPRRRPHVHFAALPYPLMPALFARLQTVDTPASWALRFIVLTACRSNEARSAQWSEVAGGVWIIPGDRTKTGKPHRVPITGPVATILTRMNEIRRGRLIFPGQRDPNKPLTDMAWAVLDRRLGLRRQFGHFTVHGFRSTFRDWAAEQTEFPGELAELSLAHSVGNEVTRAYLRGDALEKRVGVMQAWGLFVTSG